MISGDVMNGRSVDQWIQQGVSYISEDPVHDSVISGLSILEHMLLAGIPVPKKSIGIDWSEAKKQFQSMSEVKTLAVAAPERRADKLSGGNIQRMVLARAISRKPKLLVVSYPTRGLEIGITRATQNQLLQLRSEGSAILLSSENLTALCVVSDRMYSPSHHKLLGPHDPIDSNAQ